MKTIHACNLVLLTALITLSIIVYPQLPDRIPLHFGAGGEADAWGERTLLRWLLLPLIATGICLLTYAGAWFSARDPKRVNMLDRKRLLQLPRESQLWVLQGLANPLYIMALVVNVSMCLFQYGAFRTAVDDSGRAAILAGLLLALLSGPFLLVGLLLSVQKRLDRAWQQWVTAGRVADRA
ncbi:MAG TPA: DUF1648 domain-containing protein [Longimicrobiales bacterium]|nr:DUF1648 domain-containing protein [Longimicrobiales bacterium]